MLRPIVAAVCLVVIMLSAVAGQAPAQIPDEFTNLKVLPEDMGKRELVNVMRAFSGALGVRCKHCHVGEDPNDLSTFDFASDEKETKNIARGMMKMTGEINNTFLAKMERDHVTRVTCKTCHRGLDNPETLKNLLLDTGATDGADAAEAQYRELREEYYGVGSYDFGTRTLSSTAEAMATQNEDIEGAILMAKLNVEFNPDMPFAHLLLGQLLLQGGDKDAAIAAIERCLELEPDNKWAQQMLQRAQASHSDDDGHDH